MNRYIYVIGLVTSLLFSIAAFGQTLESGVLCNNGIDDDGDGLIDCQDGGCASAPFCKQEGIGSTCSDGIDNDGDGLIDCRDGGCSSNTVACGYREFSCGDGLDNDGDGKIDCFDSDCDGTVECPVETSCSNGIDDDGDGFVDYYDGDCLNSPDNPNTYIVTKPDCEQEPVGNSFSIQKAWDANSDWTSTVYGMPAIADLDQDGIPEVIAANEQNRTLFVINGEDGSIDKKITVSGSNVFSYPSVADVDGDGFGEIFIFDRSGRLYAYEHDLTPVAAWGGAKTSVLSDGRMIGIADFNQDGKAELYYANEIRDAQTGNLLVKGTHNNGTGRNWDTDVAGIGIAVDILADSYCTDCSGLELILGNIIYAVDLTGGKLTEAVNMDNAASKSLTNPTGGFSYKSTDRYKPKRTQFGVENFSATSVADYNQDNNLDVIMSGTLNNATSGPTMIFFWDLANSAVKAYLVTRPYDKIPPHVNSGTTNVNLRANFRDVSGGSCDAGDGSCTWMRGSGMLNIANIDDDPELEVTFMSGSSLYALDQNFEEEWVNHEDYWETSSGFTGTAVFDFDGDGSSEIIYRDEVDLYIIDGKTGTPLNNLLPGTFCSSNTQAEYPIVADVNGDGETEIVVSCSRDQNTWGDPTVTAAAANKPYGFIRAYKASGNNYWVPARQVWNQPAYFNVNINDNLTVPRVQQYHHRNFSQICKDPNAPSSFSLNKFLNQSPRISYCGQLVFPSPRLDFTDNAAEITPPVCPDNQFQVKVTFENTGDAAINIPIPVSFYGADPQQPHGNTEEPYLQTIELSIPGGVQKGQKIDTTLTVTGRRGDFTLYVSLNDIGPFDENGARISNTDFYPLDSLNGPVRECDDMPTIVSKQVSPLPFDVLAEVVSDNRRCPGAAENNGEVQVLAADGSVLPESDYDFVWTDVNTGNVLGSSSMITGLDSGTYAVQVTFNNVYSCQGKADTVRVNLLEDWPGEEVITIDTLQLVSSCKPGTADGRARVLINGSQASDATYDIQWIDEQNGTTIAVGAVASGLKPLLYNVLVTNKLTGCSDQGKIDLSLEVPLFTINVQNRPNNCKNPNGIINIKPDAGPASKYRYFLVQHYPVQDTIFKNSNGTFSKLAAGTYDAYMYDPANECGKYSNAQRISLKPEKSITDATASVVQPQTNCSAPYNGQLRVNITDPAKYTFTWYRVQTDGTQVVVSNSATTSATLPSDNYHVLIANSTTGCDTTIYNVFLPENITYPTANPVVTSHQTTCNNNGSIQVTATPALGNYRYYLLMGSDTLATNSTGTFTGLAYGPYTALVRNLDTRCFSAPSATALVEDRIAPFGTVNIVETPQTNCDPAAPNGALQANVNGITAGYSFTWYKGVGQATPVTPQPAVAYQLTNMPAGNYTLFIANTTTGCDTLVYTSISDRSDDYKDGLAIKGFQHLTYCAPNPDNGSIEVELTASASGAMGSLSNYTFYWYEGDKNDVRNGNSPILGENNPTLNNLRDGWYAVRAERTDGCPALDTLEFQIQDLRNVPKPNVKIKIQEQTSCNPSLPNGRLEANVDGSTADYEFNWFRNNNGTKQAVALNTPLAQNLPVGDYILEVVSQVTLCRVDTLIKLIDNMPDANEIELVLSSSSVTACDPNNGSISVTDVIVQGVSTGDPGAYIYDVYHILEAGVDSVLVASQSGPVISNLDQGRYSVIATNDTTSCESIAWSINVGRDPSLDLTFSFNDTEQSDCFPPNGQLEVVGLPGDMVNDYSYQWYMGSDTSFPLTDSTNYYLAGLRAENYTVAVTSNATGCTTVKTFSLGADANLLPVPEPGTSITPATSCEFPNGVIEARIDPSLLATSGYSSHNQNTDFYYYWFKDKVKYKSTLADPAYPDSPDNYDPLFVPDATNNRDTITNLEAGRYILVIVDAKFAPNYGCRSTKLEYIVPEDAKKPAVISTQIVDNINCSGTGSGSITVEADKRAGDVTAHTGFTFYWYNSDIPGSISSNTHAFMENANSAPYTSTYADLQQGNYSVRMVDNTSGCDTTLVFRNKLFDRPVPPEILDWTTTAQQDCNANMGSIEITQISNGYALVEHTYYLYGNESDFDPASPATNALRVNNSGTADDWKFLNLEAGIYYAVAVRNATSCPSLPQTIEVKDSVVATRITLVSRQANSSCDLATGNGVIAITIAEADGTVSPLGYQVEWRDEQGNPVTDAITDLSVSPVTSRIEGKLNGQYYVSVKNLSNGCDDPVNANYRIEYRPVRPEFIANGHTATMTDNCENDGVITINQLSYNGTIVNMPDATFSFEWRFGSNNSAGATAFNNLGASLSADGHAASNLPEGTYYVVATKQGCVSDNPLQVVLEKNPAQPMVSNTAKTDFITCSGVDEGSLTVSVMERNGTVPAMGYTFSWYHEDGSAVAAANISNNLSSSVVSGLRAGSYQVIVENPETLCADTVNYVINEIAGVLPVLTVSKLQEQTYCWGNGAAEVSGITFQGISKDPGTYTFKWYEGDLSQPIGAQTYGLDNNFLRADSLVQGLYWVQAVDNTTGCLTAPIPVEIYDNSIPVFVLPDGNIEAVLGCEPATKADGQISIQVNNSQDFITRWYSGQGIAQPSDSIAGLGNFTEVSGLTPGFYTVYVEDRTTGCTDTQWFEIQGIEVPLNVALSTTPYSSCVSPNGQIAANVSGGYGPYQFSWYLGSDTNTTPVKVGNDNMLTDLVNGLYTVVVQDLTEPECEAVAAEVVVEDGRGKEIEVSILQDFPVTSCDEGNPNGQLTATVAGDISRYHFFWYRGRNTSGQPIARGVKVSNLAEGDYTVIAKDKVNGCLSGEFYQRVTSAQEEGNFPAAEVQVISHVTQCNTPNGSAIAVLDSTLLHAHTDYEYIWTNEQNRVVMASTRTNIVSGLSAGTYTVTVYNTMTQCYMSAGEVNIQEEIYTPEFEVITTPSTCMEPTGTLTLEFTEPIQIVDVSWETPVGFASGFHLTGQPAGEYTVSITDANGCVFTKTAKVASDIFTFNGVSPNGDNKNDKFLISCIENFARHSVRIYNRTGALVYENQEYDNENSFFNGYGNRGIYIGGAKLPDGTYFYIIDKHDGEKPVSGYLELLR